jgi:hypothetical protein
MNWAFPSNNYGDTNGIGHSGIETFQGTPLKSLAREICQNSLDATINGEVTEVEFSTFQLKPSDFPDLDALKEALIKAQEFWGRQKVKKTKDFLERGLHDITSETINFLRISDFNTTGLQGSKGEYNTPWCNLTKSSGASDKAGTAGGSYGIGKFAPFACSSIRTVFYNTLDDQDESAFQGVSRIVSFKNDIGQITTGTGYFGGDRNSPIFENIVLDPSFSRNKSGTDIYIAGFKFHSLEWKDSIIASVLDGFLYAVFTGKLVVTVDDVVIERNNLKTLIEEYSDHISEHADIYYNVLTSSDTEWFEEDIFNKGLIRLGLRIEQGFPRKVAMIRKTGMKIMNRSGISGIIPFAGVMLIEGDEINDFLRQIENPMHTQWEPDRAVGHERIARAHIKALIDFIKEKLNDMRGDEESDEIDPSVGEYLPDDEIESEKNKNRKEEITDEVKDIETRTMTRKPRVPNKEAPGNQTGNENGDKYGEGPNSGSGHNDGRNGEDGEGSGEDPGDGSGPESGPIKPEYKEIEPSHMRFISLDKDAGKYSILFIPAASADTGELKIYLSAETQSYEAPLKSAKCISQPGIAVDKNIIKGLMFKQDIPLRLVITLEYQDLCSLEVRAYGLKA